MIYMVMFRSPNHDDFFVEAWTEKERADNRVKFLNDNVSRSFYEEYLVKCYELDTPNQAHTRMTY